jgi:acyl-CoA reductase-like NAD-dependent aldehyde dehydrogenase
MTTDTRDRSGRPAPVTVEPGRLFIGGTWRDSESRATTPTVNPTTEEVIVDVARGSAGDADAAARAAAAAFEDGPWSRMRGSERAKLLHRIADLLLENAHELAYLEAIDMGKL